METVLSSRLAGARECGGSLRAFPRRRRRRSICPISAVARLECAPSAAYPLSPRRREILRPPLLDRARADVHVNAQASIRDRPLTRTSPGKINPKDAATHSPDDPRWGGRLATLRGHPSKSSRPPTLRLDKTFGCHRFVTSFPNSSTSQGITLPELERGCPPDLRLQDGNVAPCATRRPSRSATAGPRLQWPACNRDAS